MEDQAAESNGAGKSALAMSAVWALTGHSDARNEVSAPVRWFSLLANVCQYGQTGQVLQCHADTMGHQRLAAVHCLHISNQVICIIPSLLCLGFVVLFPKQHFAQ